MCDSHRVTTTPGQSNLLARRAAGSTWFEWIIRATAAQWVAQGRSCLLEHGAATATSLPLLEIGFQPLFTF